MNWETFICSKQPLGHPLGNDFDHWQFGLSQLFLGSLNFYLQYSQTRKGEGSLYTPWDEPWMDNTVEEGYSEPFPTVVVEKRKALSVSIRYFPSIHWGLEADYRYCRRQNANHITGDSREDVSWRIGLWFDGEWGFTL